jgi:hypothetical protein
MRFQGRPAATVNIRGFLLALLLVALGGGCRPGKPGRVAATAPLPPLANHIHCVWRDKTGDFH